MDNVELFGGAEYKVHSGYSRYLGRFQLGVTAGDHYKAFGGFALDSPDELLRPAIGVFNT